MTDIADAIKHLMLETGFVRMDWRSAVMIGIGCLLIYLAIRKGYEPLLLLPIGFAAIMVNLPGSPVMEEGSGLLWYFYRYMLKTELVPCLIFLSVGALTDFGPLLANPKTFLLGAAAQFGVFATLLGSLALGFTLKESATIGIIGGADGPTTIYTATKLAPHLFGPVAVSAYSYMALVPIIQPPIMRLLTSPAERRIVMKQMKPVSKTTRILFPIIATVMICLLIPEATPLIGMLMVGNLFRESGVVERLSRAAQNELVNVVTIILGLGVGATMNAKEFLTPATIKIFVMGAVAFGFSTAAGVLFAKLMNVFSKEKINPLIGAAGVSAVPMAARVVQKMGLEEDPDNHLLMYAMGPNVAGVIGTVAAAGILISLLK